MTKCNVCPNESGEPIIGEYTVTNYKGITTCYKLCGICSELIDRALDLMDEIQHAMRRLDELR